MTMDPKDKLPSNAELDAILAQIDEQKEEVHKRQSREDAQAHKAAVEAQATKHDAKTAQAGSEAGPDADESQAKDDDAGPALIARITELEAEIEAMKDKALRAMAEADNVKKRAEREVVAAKIYGVERFAVDMLSVSDNLGRALMGLDDKARDDMGPNAKSFFDGIELTEKELMAVFARHGIKAVPGVGAKFDPNLHQAVAQIPSSEAKGDVANVMQTGFTLGDRTLRAAMVAVSTGPAQT